MINHFLYVSIVYVLFIYCPAFVYNFTTYVNYVNVNTVTINLMFQKRQKYEIKCYSFNEASGSFRPGKSHNQTGGVNENLVRKTEFNPLFHVQSTVTLKG